MTMENTLQFREATLDDLSQLLALEQKVVDAERPFNDVINPGIVIYYDIELLISDVDSYLIVLEEDEVIVATGYAQIRPSKSSLNHSIHSYLGFMYVSPTLRGRGINKALVEQLVGWSKDKGAHAFYLEVYSQNASAIRAYEKFGFEPSTLEMQLIL